MLVWVVGLLLTVALFFAMFFATLILFPIDKKRKAAHRQCYWWADILTNLNPQWRIHVSGLEHIDKKEAYVIVANHQSLADIILLYKMKMQFKWVAKEDIFRVPVIGWCLKLAKHISLKRGDFSSIRKVYKESAGWLRKDVSIVFFPEGSRSETVLMNDFYSGAFKLAIKEKRSILPIVLYGTRNVMPKGSWVLATKIDCALKVLSPIMTEGLGPGDAEDLKESTWRILKGALDKGYGAAA